MITRRRYAYLPRLRTARAELFNRFGLSDACSIDDLTDDEICGLHLMH